MTHLEYIHTLCKACQKCCKMIAMDTTYPYEHDVIEFYETRGFTVSEMLDGNCRLSTMNLPCPHLCESGCTIYDKRPDVCRIFDGSQFPDVNCAWNELFDNLGIKSLAQFMSIYGTSTEEM